MEPVHITRCELYEKLWAKPIEQLTVELGVSQAVIIAICRKRDIPYPWKDFWKKKSKEPKKLPDPRCNPTYCIINVEEQYIALEAVEQPQTIKYLEDALLQESTRPRIKVGESLSTCHPFIRNMNKLLKEEKTEYDRTGKSLGSWVRAFQPSTRCGIQVRTQVKRAKLIMGAIFDACVERGYTIVEDCTWKQTVLVNGHEVSFELKEDGQNRLRLILENWSTTAQQSWSDGKVQRVEGCLNSFMDSVIVKAAVLMDRDLLNLRREEKKQLIRDRINDLSEQVDHLRKQQSQKINRLRDLKGELNDWELAGRLRHYLSMKRSSLEKQGVLTSQAIEELEWAQTQADYIDPLNAASQISDNFREEEIKRLQQEIADLRKPYYIFGQCIL